MGHEAQVSCSIHARAVTSPSGRVFQVMEVDCPRSQRSRPLMVCLACSAFARLGHGRETKRTVECTPDSAPPAAEPRLSSTQDTAADLARECPFVPARLSGAELEEACRRARASEVLVVDGLEQIVGVVGVEDVSRARVQQGLDPDPAEECVPLRHHTAASLARPLLVQVEANTPVAEVSALMSRTSQTRVVVVDQGRPVGQVLLQDVEQWLKGLTTAWPLSAFGGA